MKKYVYVFMGGGAGALIRSLATGAWNLEMGEGVVTTVLLLNLTGAFLIGFFMSGPGRHPRISREWRLFAATGVLGGLTTFSTLSMEAGNLFLAGNTAGMFLYLSLSVGLGLAAAFLGHYAGEHVAVRSGISHLPLANGMKRNGGLPQEGDA